MRPDPVFGTRRQPLLRKHISTREIGASLAVLAALAAVVAWVAAQKDAFNPSERDLPYTLLAENPVQDRLYRQPLRPWVDPGSQLGTGAGPAQVELGLFPLAVLEGGWALQTRPRVFDAGNLYEKINGEAEKFLRQGFQSLSFLALRAPSGGDEIALELFDQGTFGDALGIFSGHRGSGRPVVKEGDALFYRTPVGAVGFKGRYFFRIAGNAETPAVKAKTAQLVAALAGLAEPGEAMPFEFRLLTGPLGIDPSGVSFQRSNVFQYDFASNFWFGQPDPAGEARLFLHQAATPAAAGALFARIVAEHAQEFDVLKRKERRALMRHPFLKTHFFITVRGRLVHGVEGAPRPEDVERLMGGFSEALSNET